MTDTQTSSHSRPAFSGHPLRAIRALDYTILFARDMAAMRRFYAEVMRFEPYFELLNGDWVEYRVGNHDEALRLLRQAYASRSDPEIGAHLGEVLWSYGQREEARKVWTEAKARDGANDVLKETLSRLKVGL